MTKCNLTISFGLLLLSVGFYCPAQKSIIDENKAIAVKIIEAWNNHDALTIASLFPATFLHRDMALNMQTTTNPELSLFVQNTVKGVPDMTLQVNSVIASDTMAMVEWTWKGTFTGGWGSKYPANNMPFTIQGVSVMIIKNGKIVRNFDYYNGDVFKKNQTP